MGTCSVCVCVCTCVREVSESGAQLGGGWGCGEGRVQPRVTGGRLLIASEGLYTHTRPDVRRHLLSSEVAQCSQAEEKEPPANLVTSPCSPEHAGGQGLTTQGPDV